MPTHLDFYMETINNSNTVFQTLTISTTSKKSGQFISQFKSLSIYKVEKCTRLMCGLRWAEWRMHRAAASIILLSSLTSYLPSRRGSTKVSIFLSSRRGRACDQIITRSTISDKQDNQSDKCSKTNKRDLSCIQSK